MKDSIAIQFSKTFMLAPKPPPIMFKLRDLIGHMPIEPSFNYHGQSDLSLEAIV